MRHSPLFAPTVVLTIALMFTGNSFTPASQAFAQLRLPIGGMQKAGKANDTAAAKMGGAIQKNTRKPAKSPSPKPAKPAPKKTGQR
jgi:hypothetical protein